MLAVIILTQNDFADFVHLREVELHILRKRQNSLTLSIIQELTTLVQELQCVPLLGIVRSGDDDTAISLVTNHSHLRSGGSAETYVDNIHTTSEERSLDQIVHHLTRDSGITTHDDRKALSAIFLVHKTCIRSGKFHHIDRGQIITRHASDSTSDTRN